MFYREHELVSNIQHLIRLFIASLAQAWHKPSAGFPLPSPANREAWG